MDEEKRESAHDDRKRHGDLPEADCGENNRHSDQATDRNRENDRQVKISIRAALKKFGLPAQGELFDRAYAYVAEHY